MSNDVKSSFGETIYAYTRAQALEDGVLVDVSEMAREAGFKVPVAVTRAVWDQYIEWTVEDTNNQTVQDERCRLWDVLWRLMFAIKTTDSEADPIIYQFDMIPRDGKSRSAKRIKLKSFIGGGDKREPVLTIMLPTED